MAWNRNKLRASRAPIILVLLLSACSSNFSDAPKRPPVVTSTSSATVGQVNVDIVAIDQWQDVQSRFSAAFGLTPQDALKAVNQASSFESAASIRSTQTGLGIEANGNIISNDSATNEQSATTAGVTTQTSSTSNSTDTKVATPGSAPSTAPPATIGVPPTSFGTTIVPALAPQIGYQSAEALRNRAAILDEGFGQIAPCGYVPIIVTLRVSIIPSKRYQPYDTFLDLSILPGSLDDLPPGQNPNNDGNLNANSLSRPTLRPQSTTNSGVNSPVNGAPASADSTTHDTDDCGYSVKDDDLNIVSFSSDSLENSQSDLLAQQTKALVLAAAVRAGTVAASATYENLSEELDHTLSLRPNSLLTVGRMGKNSLHIRLGANQFGTDDFEMLPLEHDITVILLVPSQFANPGLIADQSFGSGNPISAIGHYYFRDARSGVMVPDPIQDSDSTADNDRVSYLRSVATAIEQEYPRLGDMPSVEELIPALAACAARPVTDPASKKQIVFDFFGVAKKESVTEKDMNCTALGDAAYSIQNSTLTEFEDSIFSAKKSAYGRSLQQEIALDLWQRLTEVSERPGIVTRVSRRVPQSIRTCPADEATFTAKDDGTNTTVSVTGTRNFNGQTQVAKLLLHNDQKTKDQKNWSKEQTLVTTFTVASNDLVDLKFGTFSNLLSKTDKVSGGLTFNGRDFKGCWGPDHSDGYNIYYQQDIAAAKPGATGASKKSGISAYPSQISKNVDSTATVPLTITLSDVKADSVIVSSSGTGDILNVAPVDPKLGLGIAPKAGKVTVTTSGDYVAKLENLSAGSTITLNFQFQSGGKPIKSENPSIKLTVASK